MGSLSPLHLGAVGLGSMIFNFFYWNFGFLRMGTTGMTAQAFGREDHSQISLVFYRAIFVGLGIGLVLLFFQFPLAHFGVWAMQVEGGMIELVMTYVLVRVWAAPATFSLFVLFGWSFGLQDAKKPMWTTIMINVVNIVLSYIFITYLNMGIFGVALGTVIAQYIGVATIALLLRWSYNDLLQWPTWKNLWHAQELLAFFTINKDIFIRTVCLTLVFAFFYSESSAYGEVILGLNIVLQQFLNWMSYGVDGFAYAAESVVGRWMGIGNESMIRLSVGRSFLWGGVAAILFALVYAIGGEFLFSIFTEDASIMALADDYLWWVVALPILGFASYIWDGVFVGMTAARAMRHSMMISMVAFFLSFFLMKSSFGFEALWYALSVFLLSRAAIQWYMFYRQGTDLK